MLGRYKQLKNKTMKTALKKILKYCIPMGLLSRLTEIRSLKKIKDTKRTFIESKPGCNYLTINDLKKMQFDFEYPSDYGYSEEILDNRGFERTKFLMNLIPEDIETTLELGCYDGMVSYHLMKEGKKAIGIDNSDASIFIRAAP